MSRPIAKTILLLTLLALVSACKSAATDVSSTATSVPPSPTAIPPTATPTQVPPTATLAPPTATSVPPTATPIPTPATVDYTPVETAGWGVSTPANEGLDPKLVADLYRYANELPSLYGLLLVKNDHLIAEAYFNGGWRGQRAILASVTKSYTSALIGIALEQGCLSSVDQTMIEFFPEFADQIDDPRKEQITIGDMLKMRSGYPWEEFTPPYLDMLFSNNNWLPHIVEFPLTSDPGTEFGYSNMTAHLLGVIVARACDTNLLAYGKENLFSPMNAWVGDWPRDANGYYYGSGDISFTARDAAKFGLLYLNHGEYAGHQIVSADWVSDSLQTYSDNLYNNRLGYYFRDIGYGYLWWSARAGDHHFNYAWGHGGNLIILLEELDMVIVTTANPLHGISGEAAWRKEGAIIDLVGRFINSIPSPTSTPPPTATSMPTATETPQDAPSEFKGKVDVGGYEMYLHCMGTGTPTVILEAGYDDVAKTWSLVQPEVARSTRACAYDRAGLGQSDPGPEPRNSLQMVKELHALLDKAGIKGPYVLVGHSLGGMYGRLFADRYPEDVAGLVLVDSSHIEQFLRNAEVLPPESPNESESLQFYREWFTNPPTYPTLPRRLFEAGSLGNMPLVVLTSPVKERADDLPDGLSAKFDEIWVELQKEWAKISTNSTHIIAHEGGHFIQHDQPDLVIDAVLQVIEEARR